MSGLDPESNFKRWARERGLMAPERGDSATDRERIAASIAERTYGSDDVIVVMSYDGQDRSPRVRSVDGGYWIEAEVWVSADAVEEKVGRDV